MPFLQFDLDLLNDLPNISRATALPAETLAHGLLQMWARCFRERVDVVSRSQLAGFFGGEPEKVAGGLAGFGVLAAEPPDGWRVRGAERYLRIREAQRKAAAATNQKRTVEPRSSDGGPSCGGATVDRRSSDGRPSGGATVDRPVERQSSDGQPRHGGASVERRSKGALTPNTDHRSPITGDPEGGPARARVESTAPEVQDQAPSTITVRRPDGSVAQVVPQVNSALAEATAKVRAIWCAAYEQAAKKQARVEEHVVYRVAEWVTAHHVSEADLRRYVGIHVKRGKGLGLLPACAEEYELSAAAPGTVGAAGYTNDRWAGRKGGEVKL